MSAWRAPRTPQLAVWLAAGAGIAVVLLAVFGLRASREGQRSSVLLVERRADEAARLLVTALTRDMRAVQSSILTSADWDGFTSESAHDVTTVVASAFARYPYPECFVAWTADEPADRVVFFTRADRLPKWLLLGPEPNRYPVRMASNPQLGDALLTQIQSDAGQGRLWSLADRKIEDVPYQVIVRLRYRDRARQDLAGAYGFIVNLAWVREHYFSELTRQIARIGGEDAGLALGIVDDNGAEVVSTGSFVDTSLVSRRPFPVTFFDPIIASVNAPAALSAPQWTVQVSGAADPALAAATRGADITVGLAALAAIALVVALVLSVRAVRAGAELAEMRADFLSSITHELKTPIAAIRALGDTMVTGRTPGAEASREYAGLIVQESKRLARLVENLLAHARITDIAEVYSFEPLDVDELVRNALRGFQQQLTAGGFTVEVDVPPDLSQIRADRTAMELVLDNLIDNAIRYSGNGRVVTVSARDDGAWVAITVGDAGVGLAPPDIDRVTRKFVRGRNAPPGGSGLGLAIVTRIVTDHHGTLDIASTLGEGTSVTCRLPKSES